MDSIRAPLDPLPEIPEARGIFTRLPPSHYRVLMRRAQGFTASQTATDLGLTNRTVSAYLERARDKLAVGSIQELIFAVYAEYAPGLWPAPTKNEKSAANVPPVSNPVSSQTPDS